MFTQSEPESPARKKAKLDVKPEGEISESPAREDSKEIPQSSADSGDVDEYIKLHFLVQMPKSFHEFWEFCKTLKPQNPKGLLSSSENRKNKRNH